MLDTGCSSGGFLLRTLNATQRDLVQTMQRRAELILKLRVANGADREEQPNCDDEDDEDWRATAPLAARLAHRRADDSED